MKIIIYHENFAKIGGIETFIFNFCKEFHKEHEIKIISTNIRYGKIMELSNYCDIYTAPLETECDILLLTRLDSNAKNIGLIKRKKTIQMVHCDLVDFYEFYKYRFNLIKNAEYVSVSEIAKESLKKEHNIDSVVIPNILDYDTSESKKILRLVSATRLTKEKGYNRMCRLCDILEKNNIEYEWTVYTNNQLSEKEYKNMKFKKTVADIEKYYNNFDYVVQLSDSESFCYTMYEALIRGVPCLVTPFANAKEEIKDGYNGYLIPNDMNLKKELIYNIAHNIPANFKFEKRSVNEKWEKMLK